MPKQKSHVRQIRQQRSVRSRRLALCLGGFTTVLLLAIGGFIWWGRTTDRPLNFLPTEIRQLIQKKKKITVTVLNATVVWTKNSFRLTNNETRSWHHCTIEINRGSRDEVYVKAVPSVSAQTTLTFADREFHNAAGQAFAINEIEPKFFLIRCTDVAGKVGLYNGVPKL